MDGKEQGEGEKDMKERVRVRRQVVREIWRNRREKKNGKRKRNERKCCERWMNK